LEKENSDVGDVRKYIFAALLVFSLVTILIAALGLMFTCCKNRCFAVMYGILLFPSWIIILVIGIISVGASVAASDEIEKECLKISAETSRTYGSSDITIALDIYDSILIEDYMCTSDCPCAPVSTATEWLSDVSRTYDFTGTYYTYKECLFDTENNASPYFQGFADGFREQSNIVTVMDWVNFFEEEFDCAGICKPATFYYDRSIELGKPNSSCIESIKDELTSSFQGLGIATLVSGILLFFVFCMQYCLWKKFD
jgi:hypothetical protein